MLFTEAVLKNFAQFTRKHQCRSFFLNKSASLRPATSKINFLFLCRKIREHHTQLYVSKTGKQESCFSVEYLKEDSNSLIKNKLKITSPQLYEEGEPKTKRAFCILFNSPEQRKHADQ